MSNLTKDLKACREQQKISLEDISRETRVPAGTFASIEDGTFFNNPAYTRTYIRSFTRMYARAIKMKEKDIIRALDEYEKGVYEDYLHRRYILGETDIPEIIIPEPEPIEAQRTPIETDRSVNWASLTAHFLKPTVQNSKAMYLVALLIVLVLSSIYFFGSSGSDDPQSNTTVDESLLIIPDSNQDDTANSSAFYTAGNLADTLFITIYAVYDKLDPVRITSDLKDKVNPYWLEKGSARNFQFRDTIFVRADPRKWVMIYNGHLITDLSDYQVDSDPSYIRLTRGLIETKKEWLVPGMLPDGMRPPTIN
jgi:hypothetical protein